MIRKRLAHTPFLDAWRASLRQATDGRGLKTELARHLATSRGQDLQVWKVGIGKILNGRLVPNGEDVLEISHRMANEHRNHPPFPRLRSGHRLFQRPSPQNQISSSTGLPDRCAHRNLRFSVIL